MSKGYLVLKVEKKIRIDFLGIEINGDIVNCLGISPIYKTKTEANKHSENGKYEIKEIIIEE